MLQMIPGETRKLVLQEQGIVNRQDKGVPVDGRIKAGRGRKAVGVPDHPAGEDSAPAPSSHEQVIGVDVGARTAER